MKIVWLICSLIFLLHAEGIEKRDPFKSIDYFKLSNGLQVYLLADPKAEKTKVRLTVNVGYDNETDDNYGISHLVEHLVFRDRRIPYHDYLDYIKEEGGTDVNGFTKRYETGYIATIDAQKSQWLVKTFATMLFDKNVSDEDLRVEKKALQTEIGEPHWYYKPLYALNHFFEFIMPPRDDIYRQDFSLPVAKKIPDIYHAQQNNQQFTLNEVMDRYKEYYYPANMKLLVAGNFNVASIRKTIENTFKSQDCNGTKKVVQPHFSPTLNGRAYKRFFEGMPKNYAYIGTKYLLDDYKRYLILSIYSESLAQRLQQQLRNMEGKTYSVNPYKFSDRGAGIQAVGFDGLNSVFSDNISLAETMIKADRNAMDDKTITQAFQNYEKEYYTSIEHDSATLMGLIGMAQYLREEQNITNKTSYDIFKSITHEEFQKTVTQSFDPRNRYKYIARDYYFFPMDSTVLWLLVTAFFIFVYFTMFRRELRRYGIVYTQRDVVFQRRTSSRFTGFAIFVLTMIIATALYEWMKYYFFKWLSGDAYYFSSIDVPYGYVASLVDALFSIVVFFVLYRFLWKYYARIVVLGEEFIAIGNRVLVIPRTKIEKLELVSWRERKGGETIGTALRFWKPLVALKTDEGKVYYIRAYNAAHLKEDLEKWLLGH